RACRISGSPTDSIFVSTMKLESPDLFRGFFVWHVVQERLRGSRGVVETSARDLQEDVPSANGVEMFEPALGRL
ncbi:MAG TPA: hypothetical protein DCL17_00515, partial [Dehalococcoidia bacterium]|nr:hypothetical protein [Dehalococcoidia bacterium]